MYVVFDELQDLQNSRISNYLRDLIDEKNI